MIYSAKDLIFLNECVVIINFEFLNCLNSYSLHGKSILGSIDNTKASMTNIFLEEIVVFDVALSGIEEHFLFNLNVFRDPAADELFLGLLVHIVEIIELILFIIWIFGSTWILSCVIISVPGVFRSLWIVLFPLLRTFLTFSTSTIVLIFNRVKTFLFIVLWMLDLLLLEALHLILIKDEVEIYSYY